MYTTTNQATHRKFKHGELKGYPEKDAATYWQCEEYPKSWGHGLHEKYVHNIFFIVLYYKTNLHNKSI